MTVFRTEYVEALALLTKASDDLAARGYPRPVLVGGGAVEFHTRSAVVSGDFDFVTAHHEAFEKILPRYGFLALDRQERLMKSFYHPDLRLGVEVISGLLFEGRSDAHRVRLVEIRDGQKIAIAPVEDLIADRLGQHAEPGARIPEMLDQAVKMFQLATDLDEPYLDKRIRAETRGELGLAYLKERAT